MSLRKPYTKNENLILFNEVNGICPLCSMPLLYKKGKRLEKIYEIAHVYPLNPKPEETVVLEGVRKLFTTNPNELRNVICLCPNCHTKFDKPRTIEEYYQLLEIKEKLLEISENRQKWHEFKIEEEIQILIERLANEDYMLSDIEDEIEYDLNEISRKLNPSISALLSKKIERNVSEFYPIVSYIFKQQDFIKPLTTEKVSAQVKLYYLENMDSKNQKLVFKNTVEWIHAKTGAYSMEAAEILASYFVQNCELFEV